MNEQIESLKAETLAIKTRMKAENGWTDEDFERALELCGDNDEGADARLGAFVEERAARREEEEVRKRETIVRAEELKARIRENFACIDDGVPVDEGFDGRDRVSDARGLVYSNRSAPHLLKKQRSASTCVGKGGAGKPSARSECMQGGRTDGHHRESIAYMKFNRVGTTGQSSIEQV